MAIKTYNPIGLCKSVGVFLGPGTNRIAHGTSYILKSFCHDSGNLSGSHNSNLNTSKHKLYLP